MKSGKASPPQITIIDYGMGNLRSVHNALGRLGCAAAVSNSPREIAEALVLPGVGAFGLAMENLRRAKLVDALNEAVLARKRPILGICLGMQLFADSSSEKGSHQGLGWIPGSVDLIDSQNGALQVPHVGWNETNTRAESALYSRVPTASHFYFDHSYEYNCPPEFVLSQVDYGRPVTAAVHKGNILGVQFHPEKSQNAGLRLLRGYLNFAAEAR